MRRFYVGLHHPSAAHRFDRCMISINALRTRKSDCGVREWMLDSGAFTEITTHGGYREEPRAYAEQVVRWSRCGTLVAAVGQDYMCEPFALEKTGLTLRDHQLLTVDRFAELRRHTGAVPVLPVLQGYEPHEYVRHLGD